MYFDARSQLASMCVKLQYSHIPTDIQKSTTPSIPLKFGRVMPDDVFIKALKGFYDASSGLASRDKNPKLQKCATTSISLKFGTVMPHDVIINHLSVFYDASNGLASRA